MNGYFFYRCRSGERQFGSFTVVGKGQSTDRQPEIRIVSYVSAEASRFSSKLTIEIEGRVWSET